MKRRAAPLVLLLLLLALRCAPCPAAVTPATPRVQYVSTGGAAYAFTWPIWAKTDLEVYVGATLQTVDAHYTVTFTAGAAVGGSITFVSAPASGQTVTIRRATSQARTSDFAPSGPFSTAALNSQLDRLTAQTQDLKEQVSRSATYPPYVNTPGPYLPTASDGALLRWSGSNLENFTPALGLAAGDAAIQSYFENTGAGTARRVKGAWHVSTDAAITDHGDAGEVGSLKAVSNLIGTVAGTLEAPAATYAVGQALVLGDATAKNLTYRPQRGAIISHGAHAVTIHGTIEAGPWQIFSGTGLVTISGGTQVRPEWWGFSPSAAAAANNAALQSALNCAVATPARPHRVKIVTQGVYNLTDGVSVVSRDAGVSVLESRLEIEGVSGYSTSQTGVTLAKTTTGSILRIAEEADGTYPGGGAGVVTLPLNYLRSVKITGINFEGDRTDNAKVSGIVGRGVWNSAIENCGFRALNHAIRFGKSNQTAQETSADGYELDYCERNDVLRNKFQLNATDVSIMAPDITRIQGNFFHEYVTAAGRSIYLAGGNDFVDISSNIFHPYITGTTNKINVAVQTYFTRGLDIRANHFEGVQGKVFSGSCEVLNFVGNLVTGTVQSTVSLIEVALTKKYGTIQVTGNNFGLPEPSTFPLSWDVIGDVGGSHNSTAHVATEPNRTTTALNGEIEWGLASGWDVKTGSGYSDGYFSMPRRFGRTRVWSDFGKMRFLHGSEPGSTSAGSLVAGQADASGTFTRSGALSCTAGAWTRWTGITATGAQLGRYVAVSSQTAYANFMFVATVTGASTIAVDIYNHGATADLADGTVFNFRVLTHQ